MTKEKNKRQDDGKIGVSYRIPVDLEIAFHTYCSSRRSRAERTTKSDVVTELLRDFLEKNGVIIVNSEKPKAELSVYE